MKTIFVKHQNLIWLLCALVFSFPLIFQNTLEYSVPMGYAGLFTQMAKQIADANFHLPRESPFYGPGGIPFAYPPFGLYLLAIPIKLTGKYFLFLRILPPLFSVISLTVLFYLTLEISKSALAAAIAVVIAATSSDLYIAHVWAAGVVRAPAFVFTLASIYFYLQQINNPSRFNLVVAGIFFGLTCMSHLMYALFCFLWIWLYGVFSKDFLKRIRMAFVVSILGLLIGSIWFVPLFQQHGLTIFFNAFDSHDSDSLFTFRFDIYDFGELFIEKISPISSDSMLLFLVLLGVFSLLLKRSFSFLLLYAVILLVFPESQRFVFLMGSIVAGCGLSFLFKIARSKFSRTLSMGAIIAGWLIVGLVWWNGYKNLSAQTPHLYETTLDLAKQAKNIIPVDGMYLALIKQDEAEWLPFLFQREPVVAQWGSEWLGKYNDQARLMALFNQCRVEQDWGCVEDAITTSSLKPDYLLSYTVNKKLNDQVEDDPLMSLVYENGRYILWQFTD